MKLSEAIRLFRDAGIESAEYDAREIFSEIGGFSKSDVRLLDCESERVALTDAISRRCEREPLQYILGVSYFYREKYRVNKSCLIPRADTEILVDYAVKNIPRGARILDLCTGSGCIGISVLKNTDSTEAVLADISEEACALARLNAEENGVSERACIFACDVTADIADGSFYAILSNPPYVADGEYLALEREIYYEPKIAFVGGIDGGDFYRRLIPLYKPRLLNDGFMAFEIGYDQADLLREIAKAHGFSCEILKDFSGIDRVAVLKFTE